MLIIEISHRIALLVLFSQCFDCLQNQTFKDEFMRREILAVMVSSNFQDEGCTWRGEVRHLEVIFVDFLCEVNLNETICF